MPIEQMSQSAKALSPKNARKSTLSRQDWIRTARNTLERKGVAAVKVDHLARKLKVTRGSFYFHFVNRQDLLEALLQEWRDVNCLPFDDLWERAEQDGPSIFEATTDMWLEQGSFRPALDLAVRDWGRSSRQVADEVRSADERRIGVFTIALQEMGFPHDEAVVRARISYLHQIGYFSVHYDEPRAARLRYIPMYLKVLTGRDSWKKRS